MNRDLKVLDLCLKSISVLEPCSVVEINGLGVKITYFELVNRLKKNPNGRVIRFINAKNSSELQLFLETLKHEKLPQTAIVYLSTEEDCSWFINELDNLRDLKSVDFVSVVFTRLRDVYIALEEKRKSLFRSMHILQPVNLSDAELLIKDFERRFVFKPSYEQIGEIFIFSGGHVGLIKSLYFLLKENSTIKFTVENLILIPSIAFRLEEIISGLPENLLRGISSYPDLSKFEEFIKKFYFINNNKVITPLLQTYIKNKYGDKNRLNEDLINSEFSVGENDVLKKLMEFKGKLIVREDLGQIIWGVNWEDQYSEWAIDQIIHRIRKKLNKIKAPYEILTKKGAGFILQEK